MTIDTEVDFSVLDNLRPGQSLRLRFRDGAPAGLRFFHDLIWECLFYGDPNDEQKVLDICDQGSWGFNQSLVLEPDLDKFTTAKRSLFVSQMGPTLEGLDIVITKPAIDYGVLSKDEEVLVIVAKNSFAALQFFIDWHNAKLIQMEDVFLQILEDIVDSRKWPSNYSGAVGFLPLPSLSSEDIRDLRQKHGDKLLRIKAD